MFPLRKGIFLFARNDVSSFTANNIHRQQRQQRQPSSSSCCSWLCTTQSCRLPSKRCPFAARWNTRPTTRGPRRHTSLAQTTVPAIEQLSHFRLSPPAQPKRWHEGRLDRVGNLFSAADHRRQRLPEKPDRAVAHRDQRLKSLPPPHPPLGQQSLRHLGVGESSVILMTPFSSLFKSLLKVEADAAE